MSITEKNRENDIKERDSIVSAIRAVTDVMEASIPDESQQHMAGSEQKRVPVITGSNREKVGSKLMELIAKL